MSNTKSATPASPPHVDLPAMPPPLPSLDPQMPNRFLTGLGLPREKVQLISGDVLRHAALFKRRSEAGLLATCINLARMPCAHDDATPLEEILEDAYVLHRREYLVGLSQWIWDTLVDKYGLSGLREVKPTVRVESPHKGKRRKSISADAWRTQRRSAMMAQ